MFEQAADLPVSEIKGYQKLVSVDSNHPNGASFSMLF
jgi:hypothetical protein